MNLPHSGKMAANEWHEGLDVAYWSNAVFVGTLIGLLDQLRGSD